MTLNLSQARVRSIAAPVLFAQTTVTVSGAETYPVSEIRRRSFAKLTATKSPRETPFRFVVVVLLSPAGIRIAVQRVGEAACRQIPAPRTALAACGEDTLPHSVSLSGDVTQ